MLIIWKDTFAIDGRTIDDDHRQLISSMNTIIRRLNTRLPVSFLIKRSDDLRGFAALHFGREERLQEQAGYPGLSAHREEHRELLVRLDDVRRQLRGLPEDSCVSDPAAMKAFFYGWILGHIIESDAQLRPFVASLSYADEAPLALLRQDAISA